MAHNSRIEWTDHTFNPWWGCTKVSPGCDNCYAETWARRTGHTIWGHKAHRRLLSEAYWQQPHAWDREAASKARRARVFCASMADVFEWRPELTPIRARLWKVIAETPHLDWLLLTKRPHLVSRLVPWGEEWPANVWLGTTVEDQRWAEKRLPHLAEIPAKTRFLSCEPLLGPINFAPWRKAIHWVIAGGESGHAARPSDPQWFRSIRNQCQRFSIPFHFKQWGEWAPTVLNTAQVARRNGDFSVELSRFGKKVSGRRLDGETWDELPSPKRLRFA
jgi:protein gp37